MIVGDSSPWIFGGDTNYNDWAVTYTQLLLLMELKSINNIKFRSKEKFALIKAQEGKPVS